MEQNLPAVGAPVEPTVRPRAWLHTVRVCNGDPGELDEALSFAADSFPLGDTGLFESIAAAPLYAPEDFVADVIGLDNMRELCALLVDLDNIEDPQRVPFPAIEDRDWRAHAGKCSRALRMLMRRIVGSGPNDGAKRAPDET